MRSCVSDPKVRRQVLDAFRDGTACFALHWDQDCLAQRFWASVNYYHQVQKFRKYYWSDEGSRASK